MVADVGIIRGSQSWSRLARRAKFFSTLTLIWLGIEGTVGVVAGILAGSVALVAFGLDSAIEGLASVIVIWRFTGTRTISADAERRAQKWVAISFFLLAPYVAAEAIETLIEGAAAETSWLGIVLTAGTLVLCPWLGRAKQRKPPEGPLPPQGLAKVETNWLNLQPPFSACDQPSGASPPPVNQTGMRNPG
jgi:divalent metal cation (Fe/Co/Zn/Cd) transporter